MSSTNDQSPKTALHLPDKRWHLASEELPPEGDTVLLAVTFSRRFESRRLVMKATHVGGGQFESEESEGWPITTEPEADIYYKVTHWTLLPMLPERIEKYPERKRSKDGRQKRVDPRLGNMSPDS
jgi:hypothetical protein